jgi:hypothetical protein
MEKQVQEISVEDIEIKIKESQFFRLRYYAEKHKDYIVRYGFVDDKMKFWEAKNGDLCFTYYDVEAHGYRTAKNIDWIQGAKQDHLIESKAVH